MNFIQFCKKIAESLNSIENQINESSRFSSRELSEILQSAKKENLSYLQSLAKINKLSAFDTSFLLSSVNLNPERVAIIKKAVSMYNEDEFQGQGQTLSDFIFRVAANIELLNEANLELFKELAQCKTDVYDFAKILKNPAKHLIKQKHEMQFAFQKVFY
ncbi:MAG: hypothetical protein E7Z91_06920 [Cyanobacteria bacterium SIG30]|nr:hypothetical protein [Cyanobacteria bacterium SIG30]